jgi:hypothetical protein
MNMASLMNFEKCVPYMNLRTGELYPNIKSAYFNGETKFASISQM